MQGVLGMTTETGVKCALWLRVSTGDQNTESQRMALVAETQRRGLTVVRTFDVTASGYTGAQERVLSELIQGAQRREYTVVLVWSLDRLTRQGVSATLEAVNRLVKAGCRLVSLQEPWLQVGGEMTDLLLAITGCVARFESARLISWELHERTGLTDSDYPQ